MKEKLKKLYNLAWRLMPICACMALVISANSSGCWFRGQDDVPETLRNYRKF